MSGAGDEGATRLDFFAWAARRRERPWAQPGASQRYLWEAIRSTLGERTARRGFFPEEEFKFHLLLPNWKCSGCTKRHFPADHLVSGFRASIGSWGGKEMKEGSWTPPQLQEGGTGGISPPPPLEPWWRKNRLKGVPSHLYVRASSRRHNDVTQARAQGLRDACSVSYLRTFMTSQMGPA